MSYQGQAYTPLESQDPYGRKDGGYVNPANVGGQSSYTPGTPSVDLDEPISTTIVEVELTVDERFVSNICEDEIRIVYDEDERERECIKRLGSMGTTTIFDDYISIHQHELLCRKR